jgi:DNA-binding NtrC family response regulator
MRAVLESVEVAAAQPGGVLICGERGTGRQLLAREVHRRWAGLSAPFQRLDCTAGCVDRLVALIDERPAACQSGTLFFAQIETLPAQSQWRLARLFDDHRIGLRPMASAAAWVSASAGDAVIRADLWQRLAGIRIEVPPLRKRREDIPELAASFLNDECRRQETGPKVFDPEAVALLTALPWHGNVAELLALAQMLAERVPTQTISVEDVLNAVHLDGAVENFQTVGTLREATRHFERDYISTAIESHRGRIADAAEALGVQRPNLYRKMRNLGIRSKALKPQ